MKRTLLLLSSLILLSGCSMFGHRKPPEPTAGRVIESEKWVQTDCTIVEVSKPIFPFSDAKKEMDLLEKAKLALSELETREAYEKKLEAAIVSCNKTKETPSVK